jgi:hypothetical protein
VAQVERALAALVAEDTRGGLERVGSKRRIQQAESIQWIRQRREAANQQLGFASRPFVLCGLPVRWPRRSTLVYERRNGPFTLQVTGHPDFGLPFGRDRLVPIFLATLVVRQQSVDYTHATRVAGDLSLVRQETQPRSNFVRVWCGREDLTSTRFGYDADYTRAVGSRGSSRLSLNIRT